MILLLSVTTWPDVAGAAVIMAGIIAFWWIFFRR